MAFSVGLVSSVVSFLSGSMRWKEKDECNLNININNRLCMENNNNTLIPRRH